MTRSKSHKSSNRYIGSRNRDLGSRKKSYRKKMSRNSRRCKNLLKKKIEKNIKEYGKGKYVSRSQAIAVAYSQVKKSNLSCRKVFRRKSKK